MGAHSNRRRQAPIRGSSLGEPPRNQRLQGPKNSSFLSTRSSVKRDTQKDGTPVKAELNTASTVPLPGSQDETYDLQDSNGKVSYKPLTGGPSGLSTWIRMKQAIVQVTSTSKRASGGGYSILPGDALSPTASHAKNQPGTIPTIQADLPLLLAPVPGSTGLVRFNVPSDVVKDENRLKSNMVRSASSHRSWIIRDKARPGAIINLVRAGSSWFHFAKAST